MAEAQKAKSRKAKKKSAVGRRNVWLMVLITILVVVSVAVFTPPQEKINQGLDIQGGLSVVLTAKSSDGGAVSSEDMEKSRAIIEQRVNALGASEAVVQLQSNDQVLVQIPGLSDPEEALKTIGKTGKLEFARLDTFTDDKVKTAIESGQYGSEGTVSDDFGNTFKTGKAEHLKVKPGTYTTLVSGDQITKVNIGKASETSTDYAVNVTLNSDGAKAFADATKDLVSNHGQIVIILDDEVQSAPAVQSEIPNGEVSITGGYTLEEAQSMQTVLESGSLPVSFEFAQSQIVGPTLGQSALQSGVLVAAIGLLLVMLYLLFFYKGLGLVTAAAMLVFAALYLGLLAGLSSIGQFSLTLSGVAGIVLTIGMAADSSILTLERFREEIRMGRSVRAASITGVKHAIQTSIDADLVTLVSALSLFFLASASVKGFGLTLALGILCDIVMMILFKAPLIRLLAPKSIAKHPGFWGVKDSIEAASTLGTQSTTAQNEAQAHGVEAPTGKIRGKFIKHDINFMGHRRILLSISAVLVVLSLGFAGIRGLDFGIEFVGGTSVSFENAPNVTVDQMRQAFSDAGEPDATIQTTSTNGKDGFLVRTTTTSAQDATERAVKVADSLGIDSESIQVSTVGPDWGAGVIQSSLIAFIVSLVLIIIYIAIRFEYKMGVIAVVTLLHDLIIVVGVYALVGREVNPNTIAALLTILGYSLYDTVVVFHRINDNMKEMDVKCTFMTMANHSINQVLIRSINTTFTSIVPVIAMLLFGSETLKDFAFAMTIGLVCGVYSSVAVATPLFSIWKTRESDNAKLVKKMGDRIGLFVFGQREPLYDGQTIVEAQNVEVSTVDQCAGASVAESSAENAAAESSSPAKRTGKKKTRKQRKKTAHR